MGKFVMSLALVLMLTSTFLIIAGPILIRPANSLKLNPGELCLLRGVGCGL